MEEFGYVNSTKKKEKVKSVIEGHRDASTSSGITLKSEEKLSKVIAYIRVSSEKQDLDQQKLAILSYAHSHAMKINEFVSVNISSKKSTGERKIDFLLQILQPHDTLIVSEISRLGRSLSEIIRLIDDLLKKEIRFIAIKENITITSAKDTQTKMMITIFGLFSEIERDLISKRTKEGLLAAKAKGRLLGRPPGTLGKSKMNGKEAEIKKFLQIKVSKASIAKIMGVSRTARCSFVNSRKLVEVEKNT